MGIWSDEISESDGGDIKSYVERDLFGETIDTLEAHTNRKSVLADSTRYSILYSVYKHKTVPRQVLVKATGRDSNGLQHHLRKLLDNNMIAEVPAPDDEDGRMSYYRITKIGAQEIEADIRNVTGESPSARNTGFAQLKRGSADNLTSTIQIDDIKERQKRSEEDNLIPSAGNSPEGFVGNYETNEETVVLEPRSERSTGETNAA